MLNVNELANSLKPVVLPGEMMKVFILKEGKEYNQGVAYLDDGTMVVVDNARKMIGKTIDIVVTSVLQTTAGKMIFGRYIEAGASRRRTASRRAARRPARGADADRRRQLELAALRCAPSDVRFLIREIVNLAHSSLPLVADGLLPDPRHHASTRSCSARRRSSSSLSIGADISRTGARARGRG